MTGLSDLIQLIQGIQSVKKIYQTELDLISASNVLSAVTRLCSLALLQMHLVVMTQVLI